MDDESDFEELLHDGDLLAPSPLRGDDEDDLSAAAVGTGSAPSPTSMANLFADGPLRTPSPADPPPPPLLPPAAIANLPLHGEEAVLLVDKEDGILAYSLRTVQHKKWKKFHATRTIFEIKARQTAPASPMMLIEHCESLLYAVGHFWRRKISVPVAQMP